jgi:hypothetical protein
MKGKIARGLQAPMGLDLAASGSTWSPGIVSTKKKEAVCSTLEQTEKKKCVHLLTRGKKSAAALFFFPGCPTFFFCPWPAWPRLHPDHIEPIFLITFNRAPRRVRGRSAPAARGQVKPRWGLRQDSAGHENAPAQASFVPLDAIDSYLSNLILIYQDKLAIDSIQGIKGTPGTDPRIAVHCVSGANMFATGLFYCVVTTLFYCVLTTGN